MSKIYTTKEKRVRNLKIAAIILAAVLVVSSALFFIGLWERHRNQYPQQEIATASARISYNGKEYGLKNNIETVLILGLDKFETENAESYNNDKQADFLMLFVFSIP